MMWYKGTEHKQRIQIKTENVLYAGFFFSALWLLLQLHRNKAYWLTVRMLVGQPVVFGILELKVWVAQLALLGAEVFEVLGTVVGVTELILVVHSWAVLAAVGGSEENGATAEQLLRMSAMHLYRRRKKTGSWGLYPCRCQVQTAKCMPCT